MNTFHHHRIHCPSNKMFFEKGKQTNIKKKTASLIPYISPSFKNKFDIDNCSKISNIVLHNLSFTRIFHENDNASTCITKAVYINVCENQSD